MILSKILLTEMLFGCGLAVCGLATVGNKKAQALIGKALCVDAALAFLTVLWMIWSAT
jgi:hypothetical protein